MPLRQILFAGQSALVAQALPAWALFARPSEASAIPARPRPNLFSAARRVTDWARPLASSSNWLFITFLSFGICSRFSGFNRCYSRKVERVAGYLEVFWKPGNKPLPRLPLKRFARLRNTLQQFNIPEG